MGNLPLERVSRAFLSLHAVCRYRTKKVSDMSGDEAIRACHAYCWENGLVREFEAFRREKEPLPWTWDHSLADARIVNVAVDGNRVVVELDCAWTALHPRKYVKSLMFEEAVLLDPVEIAGCFWLDARCSEEGRRRWVELRVTDDKNHRRGLGIQYSDVFAEKEADLSPKQVRR